MSTELEKELAATRSTDAYRKQFLDRVRAAKEQGIALGHILVQMPADAPKTGLGRALARELGLGLAQFNGDELNSAKQLQSLLKLPPGGGIVLIDSLHRVPKDIKLTLLRIMESGTIPSSFDDSVDLQLFAVTMLGSTPYPLALSPELSAAFSLRLTEQPPQRLPRRTSPRWRNGGGTERYINLWRIEVIFDYTTEMRKILHEKLDYRTDIKALIHSFKHGDKGRERWAAAYQMAFMNPAPPEVIQTFADALEDSNANVREQAAKALFILAEQAHYLFYKVEQSLRDDCPAVRLAAEKVLVMMDDGYADKWLYAQHCHKCQAYIGPELYGESYLGPRRACEACTALAAQEEEAEDEACEEGNDEKEEEDIDSKRHGGPAFDGHAVDSWGSDDDVRPWLPG